MKTNFNGREKKPGGEIILLFVFLVATSMSAQPGARPDTHAKSILGTLTEGFEKAAFPPTGWTLLNQQGTNTWIRSTEKAHTGSASAKLNYNQTGGVDCFLTPQIPNVFATDELKFSWQNTGTQPFPPDSLEILVSTTTAAESSFTRKLGVINTASASYSWTEHTFSLNAVAGNNIFLAFKHTNKDGNGGFLDDVSVANSIKAPTTQAFNVTFRQIGLARMHLSWRPGNGAGRAVFICQDTSGTAAPEDNTTYPANPVFGSGGQIGTSGWFCVYSGTDTAVTVTGLAPETTYRVHVCEYNTGSIVYNANSATGNPANEKTLALVIFVNHAATGANTGASWDDAFTSFHAALNAAASGQQIWVAAGIYKPESAYDLPNSARYYHFRLPPNVAVYGGFAGTETAVSERTDFGLRDIHATILSGDLGAAGVSGDNCYHVIYHPSEMNPKLTPSAVLDGFVIQDGNANGTTQHAYGGGIYNNAQNPTLRNITLAHNLASHGGGMYNLFADSLSLINGVIVWNTATNYGGGIRNSNCTPRFTNVTIASNSAKDGGGVNSSASSPTFNNSIIWGNYATGNGQQFCISGGTTTLNYCCYANAATDVSVSDAGVFATTNHNQTEDPEFVKPDSLDFRIFGLSACTDAGNNIYNQEITDIRGFARKLNNITGAAGTIDPGAYEYKAGSDPDAAFPTTQASNVHFSEIGSRQMQIGWTRGNGDSCIVFMRQGNSGTATLVDDSFFVANSIFGTGSQLETSGWYCVYKGVDTSFTVTGLTKGTTYRVHVCEFNWGSWFYTDTTATGNPANQATSMAMPEMGVRGNFISIANGDTLPSLLDSTDFGSVNFTDSTRERTFTILNTGNAPLVLFQLAPSGFNAATSSENLIQAASNFVHVSGTDSADFTVTRQPSDSIAAGDSTWFSIEFDPADTGLRQARICIFNDDENDNPFRFAIQGTGITLPTVITTAIDTITATTVVSGGNVTDDGACEIIARGVCWAKVSPPTVDSSHTQDGTGAGGFHSRLTNLSPNTRYVVRAYATNSTGTSYGADSTFCTLSAAPTRSNVTCASRTTKTTTLAFTAVGGFGTGKVEYYQYVLKDSANHLWTGKENIWPADTLKSGIPKANTDYYLHVKGFNADSLPNGTLALGPYQWDGTPISPVTQLDVKTVGSSLEINWANPKSDAFQIQVWLKGYGGYPQYTGSAPAFPKNPAEAAGSGWVNLTNSLATSLNYSPINRDFYYVVIFVEDRASHFSAATVDSALSYWLGDVNIPPDGQVNASDIAVFASAFYSVAGEVHWNPACDVGPTLNRHRTSRPVPDQKINFDDLMLFAMNYENTGMTKMTKPVTNNPITLDLHLSQTNGRLLGQIHLVGNAGLVKALEIPICLGPGLSLLSVSKGRLVSDGDFFLSNLDGGTLTITTAALDESGLFDGPGILAEFDFQVNGSDPDIQFGTATARTAENASIEINYQTTDVELLAQSLIPTEYKLHQNFPNPFNPRTTIRYDLKENGPVKITLYNSNGQFVATLLEETKNAGYHRFDFEAGHLPSGMYIYKIQMNEFSDIRKLVLIK